MMWLINAIKKIFLVCVFLLLSIVVSAIVYRFDNYAIYAWEAHMRWGCDSFNSHKFQEVSINDKAKMMCDLLRKKKFIGETPEKVKIALGERTGDYYNDEAHLTYNIFQSGRTTWDVVFILDYETRKIGRIYIYRQRGGITRAILYVFMEVVDRVF